jgi:hypothetical protein
MALKSLRVLSTPGTGPLAATHFDTFSKSQASADRGPRFFH